MAQKIDFYGYDGCSTCRKALKFLDAKKVSYKKIAIVDSPPTTSELKKMLKYVGELKKLFNTSGMLYREMKISQKLPKMTDAEAITLLSKHGKLIKRPFLLGKDFGLVGFKEEEWKKRF